MGLFGKKSNDEPTAHWLDDVQEPANYDEALSYLVGLSDEEYKQVTQVAEIHRKALQESAAVLGRANEPTTFINQPEPANAPDDEPDFLEMPEKAKPKTRKIAVKE